MGFAESLSGLLGLGGDIYGGILSKQAMDWLRGAYTNNLNFGRDQYSNFQKQYNSVFDPARDQALRSGDQFSQLLSGALGPYMEAAGGLSGQIPGLFDRFGSYSNDQIAGGAGGLSDIFGGANSIFGDRGWTPQNYRLFDQGQELATGQNDPMRALSNLGQGLLNSGGGTDLNRILQERGIDAANSGGLTDILRSVLTGAQGIQQAGGATGYTQPGIGEALQMLLGGGETAATGALSDYGLGELEGNLGVGGLTRTGAMGELAALQGLQTGGATANSRALQAKALEILKTNPTMSLEDAVSAARDAAATAAAQQGETVRARALARGGGPGSIVASGSQNQAMGDFADQAMRAEAAAGNDARAKQQSVLMDYLKSGAGMAEASGGLERGTLGTYADLLKGLESVAANRFSAGGDLLGKGTALATDRAGTGFSGLTNLGNLETNRLLEALKLQTGAQGAATSNAGTLGQLGLGGSTDQTSRMGLGGKFLEDWLSQSLAGMNLSAGANQSAQGYGLGAGNLGLGAGQGLGQLGIGAGQLGQSQFRNIFDAFNTGVSQQGSALDRLMQGQQNLSMNPLLQLGQQVGNWMNTFGNNMSQLPGLPSGSTAFTKMRPSFTGGKS